MKNRLFLFLFLLVGLFACEAQPNHISLKGEWLFQLDPHKKGITEKWFAESLADQMTLPGTTDEAGKGEKNIENHAGRLSRIYMYKGAAWYQREVEIPKEWKSKHITFFMERTKTSKVWIDDQFVGSYNSLTTAHQYDLSKWLTPGKHRISVCIDNSDTHSLEGSQQLSEHTQTNWNGILGKIELKAVDKVWMDDVQVYPDIHNKVLHVSVKFGKKTNIPIEGNVTIEANTWNTDKPLKLDPIIFPCKLENNDSLIFDYYLGDKQQLWDEFSPTLYKLKLSFKGDSAVESFTDFQELNVGVREFTTKGNQFSINGKTIFLRGKQDGCVFPLTGYAPMSVEEWIRVFEIAKSYGLNHYRDHSWCPPKAAFEAADISGIYLQPELPIWGTIGKITKVDTSDVEAQGKEISVDGRVNFLMDEGFRMLKAYGNHASFCLMTLGNELRGEQEPMEIMVKAFKAADTRRLYAQGSNNFYTQPRLPEDDDFWVTAVTGGKYKAGYYFPESYGLEVRGSYAVHTMGHINNKYPGTETNYSGAIKQINVPVVGHEIGQFQVYPNFHEIDKYTGVLKAKNFEIFRERLKDAGMLDQADDFVKASGALAVICYREEIEAALRTPKFGGFQLLDLQDFPGQGSALVGILDAFMDSKGLISPEEWRGFCSEIVPLAKFSKYVWSNNELFTASIDLANYGPSNINGKKIAWKLIDQDGKKQAAGELQMDFPQGTLSKAGQIDVKLKHILHPQKLTLQLSISGTDIKNNYPLWVYPENEVIKTPQNIIVTRQLDTQTLEKLSNGAKVLLLPDSTLLRTAIPGAFQTDFWCNTMFNKYNPPGTMGILCKSEHPIFRNFPTEFHSNWQWWPLLKNGKAMVLDTTPSDFRPIVQVIDNFDRNHKLGTLFECKIGKGKIVVCSNNLLEQQNKPEARQLLQSIFNYMESEDFKPTTAFSLEMLSELVK